MQVVFDGLLAVAAVGGNGPGLAAGPPDDPVDGGGELRAVGGVALLQDVIEDDPVVIVGDLGLVAELDGLAEPALGDRAGVGVVQADSPGRAAGHRAGQPLACLRGDLAGGHHQPGQVAGRPAEPAPPPAGRGVPHPGCGQGRGLGLGAAQRPAGIGQQPPGVPGGLPGQAGQFPSHPCHHGLLAVAGLRGPGAQLRGDRVRPPTRRPAAVAHPGPARPAGRLDPPPGRRDAADGPGQQPRVGRVGHVRGHHRGVRAQPGSPQQLRFGCPGQQRLVQPLYRGAAAPGGQLHQRRRMRHLPIQRDPAKSPPADRVADLGAQALIAQPVAELQEHQPQVALRRRGRTPQHRVKVLRKRREEHRVIQQRIDPAQLSWQAHRLRRQ